MADNKVPRLLSVFVRLGFEANEDKRSGGQWFGDCPLCDKTDKFYVNGETGLWDCKSCNGSGNVYGYMSSYYQRLQQAPNELRLKRLAENRGLPIKVIERAGIVWDGEKYLLPVLNAEKRILTFQTYKLGGRLFNLPGMNVQLYGLEKLAKSDPLATVILCEGAWDPLALRWLIAKEGLSKEYCVISTPGAGVWKATWGSLLETHPVLIAFDNDAPGRKGRDRTEKMLAAHHDLSFIDWPKELNDGYDVRDYVLSGGDFKTFKSFFYSRDASDRNSRSKKGLKVKRKGGKKQIEFDGDYEELLEIYDRWLYMTPATQRVLKVILGLVLSNQIAGDPLWLYIVGSPGSGKTELLMAVNKYKNVYAASTLTPHSLVSGFHGSGGDPSLVPRLLGKTFVLKDFTEILQMPSTSKDEIYSILRGAFDGEIIKNFGNGVTRHYKGHFSLLAGVTQVIDSVGTSSLGERFMKYRMPENLGGVLIERAISNLGDEPLMKENLANATRDFLIRKEKSKEVLDSIKLSPETLKYIVTLAELVSLLRAPVERDSGSRRLMYRPQPETGTRIAKQLKKMALGLCLVNRDLTLTKEDLAILSKMALDTSTMFLIDLMRTLNNQESGMTLKDLSQQSNIPTGTLSGIVEDLCLLGMLDVDRVVAGKYVVSTYKINEILQRKMSSVGWFSRSPSSGGHSSPVGV